MAEFTIRYYYQSREGGSWSSTYDRITFQKENPNAQELKTLVLGKNRSYFDVKIYEVERRGDKKVSFRARYHYKSNPTSSSSSSTYDDVYWYDENPSISDIQALVEGKKYNYLIVSIDKIEKR